MDWEKTTEAETIKEKEKYSSENLLKDRKRCGHHKIEEPDTTIHNV